LEYQIGALCAAVPHYWIAAPDPERIELFQLEDQHYVLVNEFTKSAVQGRAAFPGWQLPPW
jgi:Uma2 family endonuclease